MNQNEIGLFIAAKRREKNMTQEALAMIISYVQWKSIGWAILHGVFGWGYVIYYLIRY